MSQTKPPKFETHAPLGALGEFARHPVEFLCRLDARQEPVVRSRLGPLPQWFVFDADLGREVLQQRNDDFNRPPYMRHLVATVTGANLFTTTGEEWQRRRRLLQPEFHRAHVAELIASMSAMVGDELDRWAVPGTIDVQDAMSRLTLRVAERAMFSTDAGRVDGELSESFRAVVAWLTNRFYNPRAMPTFVPNASNREMRRARATLRSIVQTIVNERRAHPVERSDLLQLLLDARFESGDRLSDEEITAECMSFLFAGHETTASTLAWASYELARHPAVTEVARAEVQRVSGQSPPRATVLGDLARVGRVADETLRLHPPGWGIARTARRSSRLGTYRVPRGTGVIISVYTINRSPRYWNAPDDFDPDRFLPGRDARRPSYLPLAFGAGPRMCIGAAFASTEIRLVLAMLLQRFDLAGAPSAEPEFFPEFSLRVPDGIPLELRPRVPA